MENIVFLGEQGEVTFFDGGKHFQIVKTNDETFYFKGVIYGIDVPPEQYVIGHEKIKFSELSGKFVLLIHNKKAYTLTIYNDRYGMIPFYVHYAGKKRYFSFLIEHFLTSGVVQRNINYSALSDIVAFTSPLENKTLTEGVDSYAPATKTIIDLRTYEVKKEKTYYLEQVMGMRKLGFDSQKDVLVNLFIEGFKKCVKGKKNISITLSGGIDSRCLFSTALFLGEREKIHAYNASIPGSRSYLYSKKMAEMHNVDYSFFGPEKEFLTHYYSLLQYVIERTEGMTFNSEVEATWLRDHIGPQEDEILLHGAFGELSKIASMHRFGFTKMLQNCSRDLLIERLWKQFEPRFNLIKNVFSEDIKSNMEGLAKDNLKKKIENIDTVISNEDVLVFLYMEEFLQTTTKYSSHIWEDKFETAFVFGDPSFVDLMLQIKHEDKIEQKFQMFLLEKTSRQLFEFPDSNTGTRVGSSKIWTEIVHKYTRIMDILFKKKIGFDHSDHASWVKNMTPLPREILQGGLFDENKIREIISKAEKGDGSSSVALQTLILLEIWYSKNKALTLNIKHTP